MEEFERELKNKCNSDFISLKARNRPKKAKKGTIRNMQNALECYSKLLEKTSEMIINNTNDLYPRMGVSKEKALEIAQNLIKDYMGEIKKHSGF